jgi:L-ribulose-5-phosphate 4-epimerase
MTEGYIKFKCIWEQKEIQIEQSIFEQFETARTRLYDLGLIGIYPDGIGFGNISVKSDKSSSFIITGSATGQFEKLKSSHYALVTGYNFAKNTILCTGQTKASAESLSHAAVYESVPEVGAVVHVHSLWLWEKLLNNLPTTSGEIEYGTPEMAVAIQNLISGMRKDEKLIVMGGHREGILAFGSNLSEATDEIFKIYKQYQHD